ncbi:hypothetical protein ACLOJK_032249 [Asimina triloba]
METMTQAKLTILLLHFSSAFTPSDAYFINCCSNQTILIGSRNPDTPTNFSSLYYTARIFTSPSSYEFKLNNRQGNHLIRLHLFPFSSRSHQLSSMVFDVSFRVQSQSRAPVIIFSDPMARKSPSLSHPLSSAFINAIEVFSVTDNLITSPALKFHPSTTLTLWRSWVPDEKFQQQKSAAKQAIFQGQLNYGKGMSPEIAPMDAYVAAQEMNHESSGATDNSNITWVFPITLLNYLHFSVYINTTILLGKISAFQLSPAKSLLPIESPKLRASTSILKASNLKRKPHQAKVATAADPHASAGRKIPLNLLLGPGGFGKVYKGVFKNGRKVAVERSTMGSAQGISEFLAEIAIFSKVRYRHLISLIGYCEEESELILVYEFMEVGTLNNHLYRAEGLPCLSWAKRLEICIGSARDLHYLHTGPAQPAIDHTLPFREQNLANWAMKWRKRGLLTRIVDPCIINEIDCDSLRIFGEITEKCLTEHGADRPTMGEVLWNLECALRLLEIAAQMKLPKDGVLSTSETALKDAPAVQDKPRKPIIHSTSCLHKQRRTSFPVMH